MDEPEAASRPPAVGVGLCDSAPLLWRMEDLRSVRARALVGTLLGSLPRTPRQNLRLGRPLLLLPEEERVLSEERAAAALPARDQVSYTGGSGTRGGPEHGGVGTRGVRNTGVRSFLHASVSGSDGEQLHTCGPLAHCCFRCLRLVVVDVHAAALPGLGVRRSGA